MEVLKELFESHFHQPPARMQPVQGQLGASERTIVQLAAVHARELERGHRNRATLAVARKLVAYLLAVDKSGQLFQLRTANVAAPAPG